MGSCPLNRAVFLDRDGVLNRAVVRDGRPYAPRRLEEFVIVADAAAALTRLRAAGLLLIVVTNQPDIARGKTRRESVEQMHVALTAALPLDAVYMCDHDSPADCDCRKPKPGMLLAAARDFNIDLPGSYIVGDRWRDVDAGANAGCRTIYLDSGYRERGPDVHPDASVKSLAEAADWILARESREHI